MRLDKKTTLSAVMIILFLFFLWGLGGALGPLIFSFGLAYLFFPLIQNLEKKGLPRQASISGVFAFLIIFIFGLAALILPGIISDTKGLIAELPQKTTNILASLESSAHSYGFDIDLSKDQIRSYLAEHLNSVSAGFLKSLSTGLTSAYSGISQWIIGLLNLFLIPLFFFYVLSDFEKISAQIGDLIPQSLQPTIKKYAQISNQVLSGYIRGQLMVALILGILYAIGLSVVGLKFGFTIGLLSGFASIIPYAGFTLGFVTSILMSLSDFSGYGQLVGIIAIFGVVQALEGTVITPKLVGDKVGLSALATMLALIVGGNLFGVVGMIAAIPIAGVIRLGMIEIQQEIKS